MGPIYLCRAALDPMIGQGGGTIVLTSSDAGKVGPKGETVYAAAKAGVIGFVKSLARETARVHASVARSPSPIKMMVISRPSGVVQRSRFGNSTEIGTSSATGVES